MTLTKDNAIGWAVVTGAASGLGLAIAKELRSDYDLLLIDSTASGIAKASHRIEVVTGDVSDAETWVRARTCLDGAVPQWLVQCAGIAVSGSIAEAPIEHWRKALDVNLLGMVLGCRTFVADMAQAGEGHTIHIASRAAITAVTRFGPYAASKAAVVAMTETLHNEIGDRLTVTVACPSYFRSNLVDRMIAQDEVERRALARMILGSPRSAEDLASSILRAARRGDLYFFPPGEDRHLWRLKRLMPVRFSDCHFARLSTFLQTAGHRHWFSRCCRRWLCGCRNWYGFWLGGSLSERLGRRQNRKSKQDEHQLLHIGSCAEAHDVRNGPQANSCCSACEMGQGKGY